MKTVTNVPLSSGLKYVSPEAEQAARFLDSVRSEFYGKMKNCRSDKRVKEYQDLIDSNRKEVDALPKMYDENFAVVMLEHLTSDKDKCREKFLKLIGRIPSEGSYFLSNHLEEMMGFDIKHQIIENFLNIVEDHRKILPQFPLIFILNIVEQSFMDECRDKVIENARYYSTGRVMSAAQLQESVTIKVKAGFCQDGILCANLEEVCNHLVFLGLLENVTRDEYWNVVKSTNKYN